jgi:hypothetical protein
MKNLFENMLSFKGLALLIEVNFQKVLKVLKVHTYGDQLVAFHMMIQSIQYTEKF